MTKMAKYFTYKMFTFLKLKQNDAKFFKNNYPNEEVDANASDCPF